MTNENYNQAQDKKYKVLLVEDGFFEKQPCTPETIGGLEKELSGKTKSKIDLSLTPYVDDALQRIENDKYDLIVTDLGLNYPDDERNKNFKESSQFQEIRKHILDKFYAKAEEFRAKYNLKRFYGPDKEISADEVRPTLSSMKDILRDGDSHRILWDMVRDSITEYIKPGLYIAEKAQSKAKTAIFTDSQRHGGLMPWSINWYGLQNNEQRSAALSDNNSQFLKTDKMKVGNVYYYPKNSLDNFAYVIDDAIDNFVEKK